MKNIVFAVHPDDETLGAGGTLLKLKDAGDENYWCILTEMGDQYSEGARNKRAREIEEVKEAFDFKKVFQLGHETTKLDQVAKSDLITSLAAVVNEVKPDRIFVPFKNDSHSDHKVCFEALSAFFKTFRYPFIKEIYAMETMSETDFSPSSPMDMFFPNAFFDVSGYFERKMKILSIYASEMGKHPFPRSERTIEALATYRGSMAGAVHAEAFMLIKKIQ